VSKTKNFAWVMNRVLKCHFAAVNVFELKKNVTNEDKRIGRASHSRHTTDRNAALFVSLRTISLSRDSLIWTENIRLKYALLAAKMLYKMNKCVRYEVHVTKIRRITVWSGFCVFH
jgi:hypothetical protein